MEQLSLNDVLYDSMYEEREHNIGTGVYASTATDIAEKFVREIALEYPLWLWENRWFNYVDGKWRYTFEQGTSISKASYEKNFTKTNEELLERFLKEKYGKA